MKNLAKCELCGREGECIYFEKHHLEPQKSKSKIITVCRQCGDQIHLFFTNSELKNKLNTIESLQNNEKMLKYIKWIRKKPIEKHFSVAEKKRRK